MRGTVLIISEAFRPGDHDGFTVADGRDAAVAELASGEYRSICIDRRRLDDALADARWLRRRRNRLPVVALVDTSEVRAATELLACGVEELVVRDASTPERLIARVASLTERRENAAPRDAPEWIVARSPAMRACLAGVDKACRSLATVLIQGETGTGKEVIARGIHDGGRRRGGPFVAINCAAFPETLLESELFGYERGAFTGATRSRRGLFEQADGGTLFLDEIGETQLGFQVKLLRVLQEGVLRPLGSSAETRVDVRIQAASNRDLQQLVETGEFRRDLYYRLNVLAISVPPLRARAEDVVPLALEFLRRNPDAGSLSEVAPDAARLLETYPWPGNVRELENEVARIVSNAAGESEVSARLLSPQIRRGAPALPLGSGTETLRETMARFEAWVLRRALERHGDRRIATARSLGITRECLYKKLKRHGMQ